MKKALFLTDGSVDTALSLSRWLEVQTDPIVLTVVHAFSINQPLKAAVYRDARQAASTELNQWLNFLPSFRSVPAGTVQILPEILLGEPGLVLTIHLLLRHYDYLLLDEGQTDVLNAFLVCQPQTNTQLHSLSGEPLPLHRRMFHSKSNDFISLSTN